MLEFFMAMIPPTTTHQEKQVGRRKDGSVYLYEPDHLADARAKLEAHLAGYAPSKPLAGAVQLEVKWLFPATGEHRNGEYRTTKPDTDNLNKLLKDCMTKVGFWKDDAQVASEWIEKFWADRPGIFVRVMALP